MCSSSYTHLPRLCGIKFDWLIIGMYINVTGCLLIMFRRCGNPRFNDRGPIMVNPMSCVTFEGIGPL